MIPTLTSMGRMVQSMAIPLLVVLMANEALAAADSGVGSAVVDAGTEAKPDPATQQPAGQPAKPEKKEKKPVKSPAAPLDLEATAAAAEAEAKALEASAKDGDQAATEAKKAAKDANAKGQAATKEASDATKMAKDLRVQANKLRGLKSKPEAAQKAAATLSTATKQAAAALEKAKAATQSAKAAAEAAESALKKQDEPNKPAIVSVFPTIGDFKLSKTITISGMSFQQKNSTVAVTYGPAGGEYQCQCPKFKDDTTVECGVEEKFLPYYQPIKFVLVVTVAGKSKYSDPSSATFTRFPAPDIGLAEPALDDSALMRTQLHLTGVNLGRPGDPPPIVQVTRTPRLCCGSCPKVLATEEALVFACEDVNLISSTELYCDVAAAVAPTASQQLSYCFHYEATLAAYGNSP
jgi:IPT/TIG domain